MKIDKVVNPGSGQYGQVFCRIRYDAGRLSITGVEGPKRNGDAFGSCGQIVDHLSEDVTTYASGWDVAKVAGFAHVWNKWHLNDMRAGCIHQRAENWGKESLEIVTYGLNREGHQVRAAALEEAANAAHAGRVASLSDAGRALLSGEWFKDKFTPPDADSPLSGLYDVKKRETKTAGWVHVEEHPRGVLCKPCPVCGYKYGSKWLKEEVPADVLEYLNGLPASVLVPAWC